MIVHRVVVPDDDEGAADEGARVEEGACLRQAWLRTPRQLHPVTVLPAAPQQPHTIAGCLEEDIT